MLPEPVRSQINFEDGERKGDQQALLNSAHEAVLQARRSDPERLARLANALTTYVRLLTRDGQYATARQHAQEILQIEQQTPNAVEATIALGICAASLNQIQEAEQHLHEAANLSRRIGYLFGLARAMVNTAGMVLFVQGKFHLALTMLNEASSLFEEQGNKSWQEAFLRGLIYQITGQRRQCRQVLDDLVLQVEPGTRNAADYYLLWARLAMDEEELDQAVEYLNLGMRIANRLGVMDHNLWFRIEYSHYHRLRNGASIARSWAEDALQHARRYDSQFYTGLALIERAHTSWDLSDPAAAEADLDEAIRVLEPLGAAYELARARYLRALWYRQMGHPQAESAWQEAVRCIIQEGYAFILEKEQDQAFPLVAAHLRSKTIEVRKATENVLRHLANVPPPPLRIASLGQFSVWKGRRRIPDQAWNRRKAGELFRCLLLQPNRTAGREIIIEALWADHDSDNPSDLLHQATSALRHALEPDLPDKFPSRYLKVEGEQISLQLPPDSVVDFEHFERALPVAIQLCSVDRLLEALNLYSGELFPSDRYSDWSVEKRQSLAELHQRGLLALANLYLEQGQFYNVINSIREVLHVDIWNEDAVSLGMYAYAGLHNIPHALNLYRRLENTLMAEFGIKPRKDLQNLAESLRKR